MKKYYPKEEKKLQQEKRIFKSVQDKSVNRFQQNAARMEHPSARNTNKRKGG